MRSEPELFQEFKRGEDPTATPDRAYVRDRVILEVLLSIRNVLVEISTKLETKKK